MAQITLRLLFLDHCETLIEACGTPERHSSKCVAFSTPTEPARDRCHGEALSLRLSAAYLAFWEYCDLPQRPLQKSLIQTRSIEID